MSNHTEPVAPLSSIDRLKGNLLAFLVIAHNSGDENHAPEFFENILIQRVLSFEDPNQIKKEYEELEKRMNSGYYTILNQERRDRVLLKCKNYLNLQGMAPKLIREFFTDLDLINSV